MEALRPFVVAFPMTAKVETMRDLNDDGNAYCNVVYGPLLFARGLPEKDENTLSGTPRLDWSFDPNHVLDTAQLVREPMPAHWDWPLAAPLRLTVSAADGSSVELVPYGCAKLRISQFPVK